MRTGLATALGQSTAAAVGGSRPPMEQPVTVDERHAELVDEVPVALVYDAVTLAVMMATPSDLTDFAVGFSLTEGITRSVPRVEIIRHHTGVECRIQLAASERSLQQLRRRVMTGPTACGLCGVRSLAQAVRVADTVDSSRCRLRANDIAMAMGSMRDNQPLHDRTHAAHAAGLFLPGTGLRHVREDVGRHNALDKLAGALHRREECATAGAVVLTSRISIEMVQKAASIGAPVIIAASAPTRYAVRMARVAGLCLIGNVRGSRYEIFTANACIREVPAGLSAAGSAAHDGESG